MPGPLPEVAAGHPVPRQGVIAELEAWHRLVICGRPEHLPDEPPGHPDLLRPTADDQAVPGLQFGDRALTWHGTASRDIRRRSRHSSSFATRTDTELINDL